MGCNCKHCRQQIEDGYALIAKLRLLFIKRMTEDSETQDRRRKEFNQAIFRYYDKELIDEINKHKRFFGLREVSEGDARQIWSEMDMSMVLKCFDDAVKDWRRMFCDSDNCRRKP